MNIAHDLRTTAEWADAEAAAARTPTFQRSHTALLAAAQSLGDAWSGSWLPGFATLYDRHLYPLPLALRMQADARVARPSPDLLIRCRVWTPQQIRTVIRSMAGTADAQALVRTAANAATTLDDVRLCFQALLAQMDDHCGRTAELATAARRIPLPQSQEIVDAWRPGCARQGPASVRPVTTVPPHLAELAELQAMLSTFQALQQFADLMRSAAARLQTPAPWWTAQTLRPLAQGEVP